MRTIKFYKSLAVLFFVTLGFVSCEKNIDSDELSFITFYPEFLMEGDEVILVNQGDAFAEPGITALENGEEISVTTSVVGTIQSYAGTAVDSDLPNEYSFTYSATNSDGFTATSGRTVWVAKTGDLVTSIEGLYTSSVKRNGTITAQYTDMPYILIYKTGVDKYAISDGIGGYYSIGRGYGPGYRATPIVVTAVDIPGNSFTYSGDFGVGAFGGVATMSGLTVDPVAKTITFSTVWDSGYTFDVTLTQVNI